MLNQNSLIIEGKTFNIINSIENVTIPDSFVMWNKLATSTGHGESRLYLGPQTIDYSDFFNNYGIKCFFLKNDFIEYLHDAKYEYEMKEQRYKRNISENYNTHINTLNTIADSIIYFKINPQNGSRDSHRYYFNSDHDIFNYMRKMALPKISYLTLLKLQAEDEEELIYFRIFLDYEFNPTHHPKLIEEEEKKIQNKYGLKDEDKQDIVKARKGQGKFRDGLLRHMTACPITLVSDERLLIASHIKPWINSDEVEKTDPHNGILFTPTYDKLFDGGFISFDVSGKLLVSPYLSPLNVKRLALSNGKEYVKYIPLKGREEYLEYHRNKVFKK